MLGVSLAVLVLLALTSCGGRTGSGSTPVEASLDVWPSAVTISAGGQYTFALEDDVAEVAWRATGGRLLVGQGGVVFFAPDESGEYTLTASAPGFQDGTARVEVAAPVAKKSDVVTPSGGMVRSDRGAELHLDAQALTQDADVRVQQYDAPAAELVEGAARIGDAVRVEVPREALDLASGSGVIVRVPAFDAAAGAGLAEVRIRTASGERVTTYLPYDPESDLGDAVLVPAEMLAAIDASEGLSDPVDLFVQPLDVAGVTKPALTAADANVNGAPVDSLALAPQRIDYVSGLHRVTRGDAGELVRNCSADEQVASPDWLQPVSGAVTASGRTPLVFVHGWQVLGDRDRQDGTLRAPLLCSWDTLFLELFRQGAGERFDIYTFGYDSQLGYEVGGAELARLLDEFETPPVLIGHSNGGLVIRSAIVRGAAFEHAYLVGSPQLGSPALTCTRLSADGERCVQARMHPLLWSAVAAASPVVGAPTLFRHVTALEYSVARYQGTRDLAWHEPITVPSVGVCSFFLCREDVLFPANPVHTEARALSPSDYQRITAVYGNLSAGDGGGTAMRLLNRLFFETLGYETDEIVPVVSATVTLDGVRRVSEAHELAGADHGAVKGGTLADPFENRLSAEGSVECRATDLDQQRACEALARMTSLLWRHAPEPPAEPLAITSFGALPDSVAPGEPTRLRAAIAGGTPPYRCRIDAEDDGILEIDEPCGTVPETIVSYAASGVYRPLLEVTDASGIVASARTRVDVVAAPSDRAPYVTAFSVRPTSTFAGSPVAYTWTVVDPEGATVTCSLDVDGDGVAEYTYADCAWPGGQTHAFDAAGDYVATLRVEDGPHEVSAQAPVVRVAPQPTGIVAWSVAPEMLVFSGEVDGAAPSSRTFELTNVGTADGSFTLATTAMVTATPSSGQLAAGASATIQVEVSACTSDGTTTSAISVDGGGSSASVSVGRECGAAEPDSGFLQVDIVGLPSAATPDVLISNGDGVFYRPTTSILLPEVPAGVYAFNVEPVIHEGATYVSPTPSGSVTVHAGATTSLDVVYQADVPEVALWRVEPNLLTFEGETGGPAPPGRTLTLFNEGTAAATFVASAGSLAQIQPDSGTLQPGASTTLDVTVEPCPSAGTTTRTLRIEGGSASAEATIVRSCLAQEAYLAYQPAGDGSGSVEIDTPSGGVTTCTTDCLLGPYPAGQQVLLSALPTSGSTFVGWGAACADASGTSCVATLEAGTTHFVEASFEAQRYDLTLDVYNVSDYWPPAGARVELCRDNFFRDCFASAETDADRRARFTDVPADVYSYRVTSTPAFSPSHVEHWGSGTIEVDGDTTAAFTRWWPYLHSYTPTCRNGRVEVEATLRNPGGADMSMYLAMIADRDQRAPYDADVRTANFALPPGSDETVTLPASVDASGTYYVYLYASDRMGRVTDQIEAWAISCSF